MKWTLPFLVMLCVALLATGAVARDLEAPEGAANLAPAREKIKNKQWQEAIVELENIIKADDSAEAYNLLAFSQRNLKKFDDALVNYQKALNLDPKFKPAHEYLGELYIQTGQLSKAREQLKILGELCPTGCPEHEQLNKAMQEAQNY